MPKSQIEEYWERLDEYGEEEVRKLLVRGAFNPKHKAWADAWLDNHARQHDASAQERQEMRANEALEVSREANRISFNSNCIAFAALIVAIFALFFSIRS